MSAAKMEELRRAKAVAVEDAKTKRNAGIVLLVLSVGVLSVVLYAIKTKRL